MTHPRLTLTMAAGLALSLAVITSPILPAQPLSSGSGPGIGTGEESGTTTRPRPSGPTRNLYLPGPDRRVGPDLRAYPGTINPNYTVPRGPGAGTNFPDDPTLFPFNTMAVPSGGTGSTDLSTVQPNLVAEARQITAPGDRSLTLQRIAGAAIFSNQLPLAHNALAEATEAAIQEPTPLVRDQRLIAIVNTLNYLAEAHLREGKTDLTMPDVSESPNPLPRTDRTVLIRRAMIEWQRAAVVARRISNPTYRSEMLYRVVDSESYGGQTIVNEYPTPEAGHSTRPTDRGSAYDGLPDRILEDAAARALWIERPVWRDRALVAVASAASASRQFPRGLKVARMIPQPEVRTDALVKIAEAQARYGDPDGATATYKEAAIAVASIPLDDPRAVLAGVLIDNLISVGRFEDARATVVLYPDTPRRIVALGAIAESQGRRGAADSARAWIAREVAPQYRSQLYRRVYSGILAAIEANRSHELSSRER